jgi:MFS family permease
VTAGAAAQGSQRIWGNAGFLRYWFGHAVSAFGDQISALGIPFIAATSLHASASQVGILTAALWAPNLLSLFAGTWADTRRRPRLLLIAANVVQSLAIATVPVAYALHQLSMPFLCAAALALGTGEVFYYTSYQRFFVRIVARRQYVAANSLLSTTNSISNIAGPATAGVLIQAITAPIAMIVDAVTFLVSAIAIRTVPAEQKCSDEPSDDGDERYLRRLRHGASYLRRHPHLRASLACSTTMNFAAFVVQALLVLYATRQLHLHAGQIGLAMTVGATGGLLGAATAGPIAGRLGTGPTIAAGAVLYCLPFAGLVLAPGDTGRSLIVLACVEAASTFGVMLFDVNNNAMRTAVTRDDMRGRVAGAYSTVNYGIRPLGALAGGFLADHVGIPGTLVAAAALGSMSAIWLVKSPVIHMRSVDSP